MKMGKMSLFQKVCIIAGIVLVLVAASVLALWIYESSTAEQRNASYINIIRAATPESQGAALNDWDENGMPALSVEKTDFIGILEIPSYGSVLPVCGEWGKLSKYPCCFSGSVYDGSIKIGGTTHDSQYAFYRDISVGEKVLFTDMRGNRYSYDVSEIKYEKHADPQTLEREDADLTLFIKNTMAFEYIVIFCNAAK